jgi:hypothetical protein
MKLKPTIWIFAIEPLDTRYTKQWIEHIPSQLKEHVGDYNIVQITGDQQDSEVTPGAFLNFIDTNIWKGSQLVGFLKNYNKSSTNDHFLFTDAWNPAIINLKYIKDLMRLNWTFHGLWHAGSYDKHDFLGAIDHGWVKLAEKSYYAAFDHNYFATEFHVRMFMEQLLNNGMTSENPWFEEDWDERYDDGKIVRTGWPMEYLADELAPYANKEKRDLIVFPHRVASEKQVDIFKALAHQLPQYDFVVCQEQKLSKDEYHKLLSEAKIVFSANLQETLGISCYEGALLGAIPMVPDRLSYKEMYMYHFKYPSEWTASYADYEVHSYDLCNKIIHYIENYNDIVPYVKQQADYLALEFFNAGDLYAKFK